jgi:hypothetical protein
MQLYDDYKTLFDETVTIEALQLRKNEYCNEIIIYTKSNRIELLYSDVVNYQCTKDHEDLRTLYKNQHGEAYK